MAGKVGYTLLPLHQWRLVTIADLCSHASFKMEGINLAALYLGFAVMPLLIFLKAFKVFYVYILPELSFCILPLLYLFIVFHNHISSWKFTLTWFSVTAIN
jgi:hypothetical protein